MSAPYTPATLALMRQRAPQGLNAVAQLLGWPVDRTASIARKHGIEMCKTSGAAVEQPKPEAPPIVAAPPLAPVLSSAAHRFDRFASWDFETGIVKTPKGSIRLRQGQARVFNVLWTALEEIGSFDLATQAITGHSNTKSAVFFINDKIKPLGLIIYSKKGRKGYLLGRVGDDAPHALPPGAPHRFDGFASWDFGTGMLVTPVGKLHLKLGQARIFDVLWRSTDRVGGKNLAHLATVSRSSMGVAIAIVGSKIARVGLCVKSQKGHDGGYLLGKIDGVK